MLVQKNGKGSVINKSYLHICSKNAVFHNRDCFLRLLDHILIKFFCHIRSSGFNKAGTISLFAVCIQSKLGNQQKLSSHVLQGKICFSCLIFKNTQAQKLFQVFICNFPGIFLSGAYKHQKSFSDLTHGISLYRHFRL